MLQTTGADTSTKRIATDDILLSYSREITMHAGIVYAREMPVVLAAPTSVLDTLAL